MVHKRKKATNSLLSIIKLLGKPLFFLFTLVVILLSVIIRLLTIFTQKIFSSPWARPPYLRLQLPHLSFTLPTISLPHPTPKRFRFSASFTILFSLFIVFIAASYVFYFFVVKNLPDPHILMDSPPALSTKIYDRSGTLIYQIYRDENRTLIHLGDLPSNIVNATIASEDKNFYHHLGISLTGIARAFISNFDSPYLQGGSTLTQQLVKNALLSPEKTVTRKLKEVVLALWTEQIYTKDQILELYFNYVPYGGTAYGIEEGAREYFGKSAAELSLEESALLAGLPVAPSTLSPFGKNPHLTKTRQSQVLDRMAEDGYITKVQADNAKSSSLAFRPQGDKIIAPHFVMYIQSLLAELYGDAMVTRGGLKVTTTLDVTKQAILERNISLELAKLKNLNVSNGAGMIVTPQKGEVLAMVGSRDFFSDQLDGQVNVPLMPRQPGSSIKPITYTLAFMSGFTPMSYVEDAPVCFRAPGQSDYCPQNYDGKFHGKITLKSALASSYNIPAIKLLNTLGVDNMVQLARQLGITTWPDSSRFGLSLTLGGGEVTMYDLTQVYSVFAAGGVYTPLTSLISVEDSAGRKLPLPIRSTKQVIPSGVAYQISSILSDNSARAPAFGPNSVLNIPGRTVAVKTGTTNNLRDNWTIGYTPTFVVATWVGNNDNSRMSSVASGITGASPIWSHTMAELLQGTPDLTFPGQDDGQILATSTRK